MIAQDEAHRIVPALKSVQWADEIIVIDGESIDKTREICQRYGAQVFEKAWEGFVKQRQFSVNQANFGWIFSLDADEVVTDTLRDEILAIIQQPEALAGYEVPRKTMYAGRWIEHSGWFPDFQLRLFRKSAVYIESRLVHEGFAVHGEIGRLSGVLEHNAFDSIGHHIQKINRYTSLDAVQKLARMGNRRIRWYHLVFNPLSKFLRMFISNRGYRDGFQGFLLALFSAFSTQLLYAKVWELQNRNEK